MESCKCRPRAPSATSTKDTKLLEERKVGGKFAALGYPHHRITRRSVVVVKSRRESCEIRIPEIIVSLGWCLRKTIKKQSFRPALMYPVRNVLSK